MIYYEFQSGLGGCCFPGCGDAPVELHHPVVEGRSRRGHDLSGLTTIRLCNRHHQTGRQAAHRAGQDAWAAEHGIDIEGLILADLSAYAAHRGETLPCGLGVMDSAAWILDRFPDSVGVRVKRKWRR